MSGAKRFVAMRGKCPLHPSKKPPTSRAVSVALMNGEPPAAGEAVGEGEGVRAGVLSKSNSPKMEAIMSEDQRILPPRRATGRCTNRSGMHRVGFAVSAALMMGLLELGCDQQSRLVSGTHSGANPAGETIHEPVDFSDGSLFPKGAVVHLVRVPGNTFGDPSETILLLRNDKTLWVKDEENGIRPPVSLSDSEFYRIIYQVAGLMHSRAKEEVMGVIGGDTYAIFLIGAAEGQAPGYCPIYERDAIQLCRRVLSDRKHD